MRRAVGAIGGSTSVLSTIFVAGRTGVILILTVVVIITAALCWVVADAERPARLAMLLKACRASPPPKAAPQPRRRTRKRTRTAPHQPPGKP
jgi:hypothetical protein